MNNYEDDVKLLSLLERIAAALETIAGCVVSIDLEPGDQDAICIMDLRKRP